MKIVRTIGVTFTVEVDVEDPTDGEAVIEAVTEAGQQAFRDAYGAEIPQFAIGILEADEADGEFHTLSGNKKQNSE